MEELLQLKSHLLARNYEAAIAMQDKLSVGAYGIRPNQNICVLFIF